MSDATPSEAKQFVVERILDQASREGVLLSDAERHMLHWSESDPAFVKDPRLTAAFELQTSAADFEAKIEALLRQAWHAQPEVRDRFRAARAKLAEGDHYLLVMIDNALPFRSRRWWPF